MRTKNALDWQREIYLRGLSGQLPAVPTDSTALETQAAAAMSPTARAYIMGGAGAQQTVQANRQDFGRYAIVPRMLQNVAERATEITLLGAQWSGPFWLAPIGVAEMVHPAADLAVAEAAANLGIPYVFSNQASVPMESCAEVMGQQPRFFQLYWSRERDLVLSLVQRAEACGCLGIVLTLDTTLLGWRTRDLDLAYLPFLEGKGIAQYTSDPVFQRLLDAELSQPAAQDFRPPLRFETLRRVWRAAQAYPGPGSPWQKLRSGRAMGAVRLFTRIYTNPALSWEDLAFLRQHTRLPILLKGILHPDDARRAIDAGMDGVVVSNHGGRQVDGAISAIGALPAVVDAVQQQIPVLLDSGIRTGADVFKALALGASAVGLGRPYIYGLALGGSVGVAAVIQHLLADFELTMALAGCRNVTEIQRPCLLPQ